MIFKTVSVLIGKLDELDALVPHKGRKDEQGFISMRSRQSEGRGRELSLLCPRRARPYHSVPDAVGSHAPASGVAVEVIAVPEARVSRGWHLIKLHPVERNVRRLDLNDAAAVEALGHLRSVKPLVFLPCHTKSDCNFQFVRQRYQKTRPIKSVYLV